MKITSAAFALALALGAASAAGQTTQPQRFDARWTPYLGCWRLVQENVSIEGAAPATTTPTGPTISVCVRPSAATGGVTMTTFADGKQVLEQNVAADGAAHPVAESGCTGTQTSEWSTDGLRLFTHVDLACNDRPRQSFSGLTLFAKGPAWIDIQAGTGDEQQVRIRHYMRTVNATPDITALPAETTTRAAIDAMAASSHRLSQNDIIEASKKAAPQVVEAAIVETESRFPLDSRSLKQLASAKVSPNVIDLMVAQSFPDHFTVERPISLPPQTTMMMPSVYPSSVYGGYDPYDPFYYYSYYYSPFAYPYYWGSNGYFRGPVYYINSGGTVIVPNVSGGVVVSGSGTPADNGQGQVVNGRGYTRVHPASSGGGDAAQPTTQRGVVTAPRTVRGSSGGAADSGGTSSPSSSGTTGSSSSGSSGGGTVSTGGYSSGGGGDTGRTAQPR